MNTVNTPENLYKSIVMAYKEATGEDPAMSYAEVYAKSIAILVNQAFEQQGMSWNEVQQIPKLIHNFSKDKQIKSKVHWLLDRQISKVYNKALSKEIESASSENKKNEWSFLLRVWNENVAQQNQLYYETTKGVVPFGGQVNYFLPTWYKPH